MKNGLKLICLLAGLVCWSGAQAAETEVTWYGFYKLDLIYDSAQTSHGNFAMWVKQHAIDEATSSINLTARESRFGFNLVKGEVKGKLEFDFYGGGAENKNLLMLRKAYVDLPLGGMALRAGQDADVISPLVPSSLNYPVCWGAGNVGYRRPQLRLYQQRESVYWAVAVARNIGADVNGDGLDDGAAGTPVLQGRLAYALKSGDMQVTLGGSGHFGMMDSPGAVEEDYTTWSANADVAVVVNPKLKILGEVYTGSNMGTYFGSILNTDSPNGLASLGGWGNVQLKAADDLLISLGASLDTVDEEDLGAGGRSRNMAIFGNLQRTIAPGVIAGLEVAHWTTEYVAPAAGVEGEPTDLQARFSIKGSF